MGCRAFCPWLGAFFGSVTYGGFTAVCADVAAFQFPFFGGPRQGGGLSSGVSFWVFRALVGLGSAIVSRVV